MPLFKDDQPIVIAPGSRTTLAHIGLPESLTPASVRLRSCMFPAEKNGEWEPHKMRRKAGAGPALHNDEHGYEEDRNSEDGAVWPMVRGRIVNWSCFFGLMCHVYSTISPPFHTPILLVSQPAWTLKDKERVTQFFFEKFKLPAFNMIDSAVAIVSAYGLQNAAVVDIGYEKADVTVINDFAIHEPGRAISVPDSGGETMTKRLLELLKPKGFKWEICEQLKKNAICEVLPPHTPLPGSGESSETTFNPAAVASTGATGPGADGATTIRTAPRGPGAGTEVGDDAKADEEDEGVLDVASIVASGKMNELLAKKEREKQERAASKKKGGDASKESANRPVRLPNAKRERATFSYEDHTIPTGPKDNGSSQRLAEPPEATLDQGSHDKGSGNAASGRRPSVQSTGAASATNGTRSPARREIEVGVERFQVASQDMMERLADTIYRTISAVDEVNKRSELWDSLIIAGNGARVRGFKEALVAILQAKYLISPSSATIFTSELPSNLTTPTATGANTPQHTASVQPSGVNPLLYAATTAQNPQTMHLSQGSTVASMHSQNMHSGHGQSPTSIKLAKVPEYFPEWKEAGMSEAVFLGAQVMARVLFTTDQGPVQSYMSRTDYNDQGPPGIREVSL